MKEKITLKKEMETLLIPLYGRAQMSHQGLISDSYAGETLNLIDYDFSRLKIPKKLQVFMALRCAILDDFTKDFLSQHPNTLIISLGSGLDARYLRIGGYQKWIDLDFLQETSSRN